MSFEEEWVLPQPVETYLDQDLEERVRAMLPEGVLVEISGDPDIRTMRVEFRTGQVDAIAAKLKERGSELDWEWRDDLDPPRGGGDLYDVHIDIVDDERPIVRIYSNDGENRPAWPLVFAIAATLADELGGIPEEDAPAPSDGLRQDRDRSPASGDRLPMFIEPGRVQKPN